jgi:integrase
MPATLTKAVIDAAISRARAANEFLELHDDREPGLRLRAGERSATWSLLVRLRTGQRTRVKLGSWPGMGIADGRRAARDARTKVDRGGDPNAEKREAVRQAALEARSRITLAEVLDTYEQRVLVHHRRGAGTRRALDGKKGLLTTLRSRPPASITRPEIVDLVNKHARTAPISANRKLAFASAFFNWCVNQCILEANPAAKLRKPARETMRDRYHSLSELREIWAAAGTLGYPFEQMFRVLIVLPNRRDEIASLPLEELTLGPHDQPFDDAVWMLPSTRTKRANALRVPLSSLARRILIEAIDHPDRPKDSKLVFTTTSETPVSGFTKARRRLDVVIAGARRQRAIDLGEDPAACEMMPHWTVHDLRTTFNTHACEMLDVPPHVADRILNHVATATRSKVMRIYNKSELFEPRRAALNAWAELLCQRVL